MELLKPLTNGTVIAAAIVYGLLFTIGSASFMGYLLFFITFLSMGRYSYDLLRNVARGRKNLPPPEAESFNPVGDIASVLHFVLFGASFVLIVTTPFVGVTVRLLAFAVWVMVFPASAMIMGITLSPLAALNPKSIAHIIGALGRDYGQLVAAGIALALLTLLLEALIGFAGLFAAIPGNIVMVWCVLGLFALMGETVGRRRFELALPGVETDTEYEERHRHGDWQKALDRAYTSVRSRMVAQGYRTIKDELLDREGNSLEIYQWVFNHTLVWDDPKHALEIGKRFVVRLVEEGKQYQALELFEQCRRLSPEFELAAETRAVLRDYARGIGRHRVADELEAAPQT